MSLDINKLRLTDQESAQIALESNRLDAQLAKALNGIVHWLETHYENAQEENAYMYSNLAGELEACLKHAAMERPK